MGDLCRRFMEILGSRGSNVKFFVEENFGGGVKLGKKILKGLDIFECF